MSTKRPPAAVQDAIGSASCLEAAQENLNVSYSQCLDAFIVALNQTTSDGGGWFTSTRQLQLASLPFCIACRNVATLRLRVDNGTPPQLLAAADAPRLGSTRVPRLRARAVTWERPSTAELGCPLHALVDVDLFEFRAGFNGSIEDVSWPVRVRVLNLGNDFDQPIANVSWPPSLTELKFGQSFNQRLEEVTFPPSLLRLAFDTRFNQPISKVLWPEFLRELELGEDFDQAVEGVAWPVSLNFLCFGAGFNQPIAGVAWPASLYSIFFGECFNQPIAGVTWPPCLWNLEFGQAFDQPVARVAWPASLEILAFGVPVDGESGTYLLSHFDQAIDEAVWPASLRQLTLGDRFDQPLHGLGTWVPNLESFTLLVEDYSLLVGIEWPKRLKKLVVHEGRNLDGVDIPQSVEVLHCAWT